ncbi:four-carbon acid sugar kinase family protein [Prochlorococcus sp. MIT 1223]|uniref:four-carbon acid sugar kinase family protein n=1 Tax=Prochlorococcus sp. MIT 1223 TaxID=3096217 RepID=UPI002A754CDB|nr:four-carbon acid sugar kinase family protein [Prochlorococcus sp. MIT 1223]
MKIIVFDDDPTGSQSVYGCPLLLKFDEEILSEGILDHSKLLFLLTNTRSMSASKAEDRTRQICKSFYKAAYKNLDFRKVLFISRGDSTLRGHGVIEPNVINQELGPFDATFHVPAFLDGGRTTVDGEHLLNGSPVHLSSFANDQVFGYSTSYLPDWLEEKSGGKILSSNVLRLSCEQLNAAIQSSKGMDNLIQFLKKLSNNSLVVVDAEKSTQLKIFAKAVIELMNEKRFLFRSAASLISALADLPVNPMNQSEFSSLRLKRNRSNLKGLIMVGSHVELADKQLDFLLKDSGCKGVELPVKEIARALDSPLSQVLLRDLKELYLSQLDNIIESGKTPVIYTSRGEIDFPSVSKRMLFGIQLAELMANLVARLLPRIGYVISKGGITTQVFLEKGLNLGMVELKGQILPGLSVVCPYKKNSNSQIPVITFPGNLGNSETLLESWKLMENMIKD